MLSERHSYRFKFSAMPRRVDWYRAADFRKSTLPLSVASTAGVFRLIELEGQGTMLLRSAIAVHQPTWHKIPYDLNIRYRHVHTY